MNPRDSAAFQKAIQLTYAGQKRTAYEQFCVLASNHTNRNHPDLLLWIAETTPSYEEAQRAINEASSIMPYHPGLAQARDLLTRGCRPISHMPFFQVDDAYRCPFCRTLIQPVIVDRISPAGWTIFLILIVCVITIELCWLGLFLRETVVQCPVCNNNLRGFL